MSTEAVMLPLFVQVALTFALLSWMAYLRTSALNARAVRDRDIAPASQWPAHDAGRQLLPQPDQYRSCSMFSRSRLITHRADLVFV
jgi:hypothetical protein